MYDLEDGIRAPRSAGPFLQDQPVLKIGEFVQAPLGAVICMHRDLQFVDALGVGFGPPTDNVAFREDLVATAGSPDSPPTA